MEDAEMKSSTNITLAQVSRGMEVRSADGVTVGRVAAIWYGVDPKDPAAPPDASVCSRVEVQRATTRGAGNLVARAMRWLHASPTPPSLYIPCTAIAAVAGRSIILTISAETMDTQEWDVKPPWIPAPGRTLSPSQMNTVKDSVHYSDHIRTGGTG
jgi:hypothetical protein